jgi:hypothetical protein
VNLLEVRHRLKMQKALQLDRNSTRVNKRYSAALVNCSQTLHCERTMSQAVLHEFLSHCYALSKGHIRIYKKNAFGNGRF